MSEMLLIHGEDGKWKEYNPYATIDIETEEDFKELEKALELYQKVKRGEAIIQEVDDGE